MSGSGPTMNLISVAGGSPIISVPGRPRAKVGDETTLSEQYSQAPGEIETERKVQHLT